MKNKLCVVSCECGFKLGIEKNNLEEIASGVWGTINCPQCSKRFNPQIIRVYETRNSKTRKV